jgi:hypothetical protein
VKQLETLLGLDDSIKKGVSGKISVNETKKPAQARRVKP